MSLFSPILFVFLFHWFILEQIFTDGRFYSNYLCLITMKDIRLSDNPITDSGRGGVPRFVLIARLAKIQILNGSEVWQKYLCCLFAYFVYSLTKCNIFVSVLPFRLLLAKGRTLRLGMFFSKSCALYIPFWRLNVWSILYGHHFCILFCHAFYLSLFISGVLEFISWIFNSTC